MVEKLAKLDELKDSLTTDVPFDVLVYVLDRNRSDI
jgi:hypothetical protein